MSSHIFQSQTVNVFVCLERENCKFHFSFFSSTNGNLKESPPMSVFGIFPNGANFQTINGPAEVQEILQKEFVANPAWKKSEAMWLRKNHGGKRIFMVVLQ